MITGVLMVDIHSAAFIKKTGYRFGAPSVRKVPQGLLYLNEILLCECGVAIGYAVFAFKNGFLLMCSWKYSSISSAVGSLTIPTPL